MFLYECGKKIVNSIFGRSLFGKTEDNDAFPKTLRHIDENIAYNDRLIDDEIKKAKYIVEQFLQNLFKENDFCVCFGSEVLENVKETGLISAIEKSNGNEDNYIKNRKNATIQLFGAEAKELSLTDYEKYGYLSNKDVRLSEDGNVNWYGDLKAVLDKDKLFDRTTFTIGDSLDNIESGFKVIASKVANPSALSVPGVAEGRYFTLLTFANMITEGAFNSIQKKPQDICVALRKGVLESGENNCAVDLNYIELQFHGSVPWSIIKSVKDTSNNDLIT